VYVLDDGPRPTSTSALRAVHPRPLNRDCNYTTGKIYLSVIEKERRGDYRGRRCR
jgi:CTP synthase